MFSKNGWYYFGFVLVAAATMVGAPRWAGALLAADVANIPEAWEWYFNMSNVISGIAMAVLEAIAIPYMLYGFGLLKPYIYKTVKKKKKKYRQWKYFGVRFFVIGSVLLTPTILTPYIMARVRDVSVVKVLGEETWLFIWAFAVTIAPAFVLAGVSLAQGAIGDKAPATKRKTKKGEKKRRVRKNELTAKDYEYFTKTPTKQAAMEYGVTVRTVQLWIEEHNEKNKIGLIK